MGHICTNCLDNRNLNIAVGKIEELSYQKCDECRDSNDCFSTNAIAKAIDQLFQGVFATFRNRRSIAGSEEELITLEEAVAELIDLELSCLDQICEELRSISALKNERVYHPDTRYAKWILGSRKIRMEVLAEWRKLGESVKHKRRYFNKDVLDFFEHLFAEVKRYRATVPDGDHHARLSAVNYLPAGTKLYRARIARNSSEAEKFYKNPEAELGPPGPGLTGNGRMNAIGIPVLYTSLERETALAELRPALGVELVSVEFTTLHQLKVLDFRVLGLGSAPRKQDYFDPEYFRDRNRAALLRRLHQIITLPVKPENESEYIMTQMMAEYLSQQHHEKFDGIRFKSAQNDAEQNVVLFRTLREGDDTSLEFLYGVAVVKNSVQYHLTKRVEYSFDPLESPESDL